MTLHHRRDPRASIARRIAKVLSERRWNTVALVFLFAAALCLVVLSNMEAAFVAATLGIVAWFFSLRNRLVGASIEAGDNSTPLEDENSVQHHEE